MPTAMDSSDDDDVQIFAEGFNRARSVDYILQIKHNAPLCSASLNLYRLSDEALQRLGYIISQNTTLGCLTLVGSRSVDAEYTYLWTGIGLNCSIARLSITHMPLCYDGAALFLANNPNLRALELRRCGLLSGDIDFIARKLMQRSVGSLGELKLRENGEYHDLDMLCTALRKCRTLKNLALGGNNISGEAVHSLAALLKGNESMLEHLDLSKSKLSVEDVLTLIDSLETNNKLKTLDLRFNSIMVDQGSVVAKRVLHLVCDGSTVTEAAKSNHTLSSLGCPISSSAWFVDGRAKDKDFVGIPFEEHLDEGKASLVRASLRLNYSQQSVGIKARRKVFWRHMRGDFHMGDDSIDICVMPRVLALATHEHPCASRCHECRQESSRLLLVQEEATLAEQPRLDCLRLEAVFRIVRSRPGLCLEKHSIDERLQMCEQKLTVAHSEIERLRLENKRQAEEVERLKSQLCRLES